MGLFDRKKDEKKADFGNVESGSSSTAPERAEDRGAQSYTVQSGDSLWAISERFYGSGDQWRRIYEANRGLIADPDVIQPGWELNIPRGADVEGEVE